MASLDRNIIIIALPTIASDLHTSFFTLTWIVLVYWLVTASVLLNFGRLSDMFGRVKLYNIGFAIFTLGSGLCSISQTGEQLILFRIIQAVDAAFLFSNSAAIITDTFPENERAKALGLNQTAIVVGSVVGLVFGGFLATYLGWRSIFWIILPYVDILTDYSQANNTDLTTAAFKIVEYFKTHKELKTLKDSIEEAQRINQQLKSEKQQTEQQLAMLRMSVAKYQNAISALNDLQSAGFNTTQIAELTGLVNTWNGLSGTGGLNIFGQGNGSGSKSKLEDKLIKKDK
jgi:MFS family permease